MSVRARLTFAFTKLGLTPLLAGYVRFFRCGDLDHSLMWAAASACGARFRSSSRAIPGGVRNATSLKRGASSASRSAKLFACFTLHRFCMTSFHHDCACATIGDAIQRSWGSYSPQRDRNQTSGPASLLRLRFQPPRPAGSTVMGWRPRPLDDGRGRYRQQNNRLSGSMSEDGFNACAAVIGVVLPVVILIAVLAAL